MSLRPGIGASAVWDIASTFMEFNLEQSEIDVPSHLRHGKKLLPLGRYLRKKVREAIGREANTPAEVLEAQKEEVRALYEAAQGDSPRSALSASRFKQAIIDEGSQRVLQIEGRNRLKRKRIL